MKLLKSKRNWKFETAVIFIASALCFAVVSRLCFAVPAGESAMFFGYLILIALPGAALVKWVGVSASPLESLLLAFALGIAAMFALYLGFSACGLEKYFYIIPVLLFVSGAAGLWLTRKRAFAREADAGELRIALILSAAAMLIVLLSLSASNLNPSLNGPRRYHVDLLNSAGLVDSAGRGFPFKDVKADGIPYVYHALSSAFLAVMKSVTGFSNFDLVTKYSLSVFTPFAAAALSALTKRVTKKNGAIPAVFALLFLLRPFENSFPYYMYQDTLGFSLSVGLCALSALFFVRASGCFSQLFSADMLLAAGMMSLAAAAKGPVAAVCLAGFGFSFLMQLLKGRRRAAIFIRGGVMLGAFTLSYLAIYYGDAASLVQWYPVRFVRDTAVYHAVSGWLGKDAPTLAIAAMLVVTYCFLVLGLAFLSVRVFRRFRNDNPFSEFAVGTALTGMLMMNLTHQYGGSEIYFGLAGYPFAVVGLGWCLADFSRKKNAAAVAAALLTLAGAAVSVAPAAGFFGERIYEAGYYRLGSPYRIDENYGYMALEAWREDSITEYEYEAMLWLRNHTPEDSVIVTDRVLRNSRYMYGTAFSERVFYLEGYIYITSYDENSVYNGEIGARAAALERLYSGGAAAVEELRVAGADYILQSRWQNPDLELPLDVVFENQDIIVYAC